MLKIVIILITLRKLKPGYSLRCCRGTHRHPHKCPENNLLLAEGGIKGLLALQGHFATKGHREDIESDKNDDDDGDDVVGHLHESEPLVAKAHRLVLLQPASLENNLLIIRIFFIIFTIITIVIITIIMVTIKAPVDNPQAPHNRPPRPSPPRTQATSQPTLLLFLVRPLDHDCCYYYC